MLHRLLYLALQIAIALQKMAYSPKNIQMFLVKMRTRLSREVSNILRNYLICRLFRFIKQFLVFVGDKWSWHLITRGRSNNKHTFITKARPQVSWYFLKTEMFKNIRILTQRNRIVSLVHMKTLKRCKSGTHKMCLKINRAVKMPWHRPSMGVARSL